MTIKIILIIIILALGGIILVSSSSYQKITVYEMYKINKDGVIIDVRTEEEYESGHIENSINIPVDDINTIQIIDKSTQIFIYCRSGRRSEEAARRLIELGYNNVYDVGGIENLDIELTN